ncbi:MAG TPA: ATP-binding protein [Candidatus Omnitrophota bacterium]|nr:ATP-binding protein [Candidatus Omnitrophota bacterium]
MSIFGHYILVHALIAISTVVIGLFVFLRGPGKPLNRIFLFYNACMAWWGGTNLLMVLAPNAEAGLLADRISLMGIVFIPTAFLHFTLAFIGQIKKRIKLIYFAYGMSILFAIANWTPLMAVSVSRKHFVPLFTDPGNLYPFFLMFFASIMTLSLVFSWKAYRDAKTQSKKITNFYFLLAAFLATAGGSGNFFAPYDIFLPFMIPYGSYGVVLYAIITGYLIVKRRFLDIELIVKKTLVFTGLFGMAMAVIAIVTELSNGIVAKFFPVSSLVERAFSILAALLLYEPTKEFLVRATDRYLFQKKEDVRVILNKLSQNIITILDIEKVGTTILETLKDSLRLESGIILIQDEDGKTYEIMDSFGIQNKRERFLKDGSFIRCLLESDKILNLEDSQQKESLPSAIRGPLESWGAVICIPLFIHRELIGLLVLGKKKSDQEFSDDELDCFPAVAGQVAIALSNARLYHILMRSQADFAQQAKMAAIGTLSAGISHEIKNPLQVIRGIVEMLRFNKKSGLYKEYTKEQYEELISEALVRVLDAVNRATGVIDRLSSFAKKPKELKTELFSIEQAMDDALNMVTYEFEQNQIVVKKDYAANLPKVLADQHAIEEVFFNLLINARHAMVEKGIISVQVRQQGNEIEALLRDTGPGIPKENFEKIFDPFFTTKDTSRNPDDNAIKGSGLGLFLVREIVKRYSGRIVLESEVGKGTTFHIFLPASPMPS